MERRKLMPTPYLCYARKDRRTKPNDPVTTRSIAGMFESVGTDCVVTLEVHNPVAFKNAFPCRTVALTGTPLFVDYVKTTLANDKLWPSLTNASAGTTKQRRRYKKRSSCDRVLQRPTCRYRRRTPVPSFLRPVIGSAAC